MKTFLTISTLLGTTIFFSCSQEKKPVAENISNEEKTVPVIEIEKDTTGRKIFENNCISCHGADGKSKLNGAKDLSISTLTEDERIKVISSAQIIGNKLHAPRFPSVLSELDIKDVAKYIATLRK